MTAFKKTLARLHTTYPWLTVKFVPNKDDAAFGKAVAAGQPPDVFVSTAPDNVAKFCYNGTVAPLDPYLTAAKVDVAATFPQAALVYTQYAGKQCALPLLVDAYALFYNKKMLADAGDHRAAEDAVRADRRRQEADGQEQDGSIKTLRVRLALRLQQQLRASTTASQSGHAVLRRPGQGDLRARTRKWAKLHRSGTRTSNDWYGNGQLSRSSSARTTAHRRREERR